MTRTYHRCVACTMPREDRHHDPAYRMDRVPWDIPRHPYVDSTVTYTVSPFVARAYARELPPKVYHA